MNPTTPSPTTIVAESRRAFLEEWRITCHCTPLELREEHARLTCARCDAPIIRRRRTEAA